MTWIRTIPFEKATGKLRKLFDRVKGPGEKVDNILLAHGLRPHTLEGHMVLYKNVLHHTGNTLPKWLLETLGLYVSMLNQCDYCVAHHFEGLKRLLNDEPRSQSVYSALSATEPSRVFRGKSLALLNYAQLLTISPREMHQAVIDDLRANGLEDGEILEANQVCAYFAYANRTVLGLGVNTKGDQLGLSPGDESDPDNWQHG